MEYAAAQMRFEEHPSLSELKDRIAPPMIEALHSRIIPEGAKLEKPKLERDFECYIGPYRVLCMYHSGDVIDQGYYVCVDVLWERQ